MLAIGIRQQPVISDFSFRVIFTAVNPEASPLKHVVREALLGLSELLYPRLCAGTGEPLAPGEIGVSLRCLSGMRQTHYHRQPAGNALHRDLNERLPVVTALGCYHYAEGESIQRLIHQLKYNRREAIGRQVGRFYGQMLRAEGLYPPDTAVVPIPLHPRKLLERGFNQAERFGEGLAEGAGLSMDPAALRRVRHTKSQARMKDASGRLMNLKGAFAAAEPAPARVLLVDDGVTTGTTLLTAAEALRAAGCEELHVATIAVAGRR